MTLRLLACLDDFQAVSYFPAVNTTYEVVIIRKKGQKKKASGFILTPRL